MLILRGLALWLAVVLMAGVPVALGEDDARDTAQVELRVWQGMSDPSRVWVSVRPAGGPWGRTQHLPMGDRNARETFRYSQRTVDVAVAGGTVAVELRVWQRIGDPLQVYLSARPARGRWGRTELLPMADRNEAEAFRYTDRTVAVPHPPRDQCESGVAVPEPVANAELVGDCAALLGLRDDLRGAAPLNWSADVAMMSWDGVTVSGIPMRVTALALPAHGLTGRLPGALGELTALTSLDLRQNRLSGRIPVELTHLRALTALFLAENTVFNCIPLGLRDVANNDLDRYSNADCSLWGECRTGVPVPKADPDANPRLFEDCEALLAWRDTLEGAATLNWSAGRPMTSWTGVTIAGTPRRVTKLELANGGLTGEMSGLVGQLEALTEMRLDGNALTGRIPSKVALLTNLTHVYLAGNALGGCMPPSLRAVANNDLATLGLQDCAKPVHIPNDRFAMLTTGTNQYIDAWDEGAPALVFDVPDGLQLETYLIAFDGPGEVGLLLRVVNSEAFIGLHVYEGVEWGRARPAEDADRLDPLFDRVVESAWIDRPTAPVVLAEGGETFSFSFDHDAEGWVVGFADLPADYDQEIYELAGEHRPLPEGLEGGGVYVQGHNRSDDLFMYLKRQVGGLRPNTAYSVSVSLDLATSVSPGLVGIGGSPGESVFVKAGASTVEPDSSADGNGHLRMNIDKGNQSRGGADMVVLGNIAHPDASRDAYAIKTLTNADAPLTATTDGEGRLWLIAGTDSGFEGLTTLYYARISFTLSEVTPPEVQAPEVGDTGSGAPGGGMPAVWVGVVLAAGLAAFGLARRRLWPT